MESSRFDPNLGPPHISIGTAMLNQLVQMVQEKLSDLAVSSAKEELDPQLSALMSFLDLVKQMGSPAEVAEVIRYFRTRAKGQQDKKEARSHPVPLRPSNSSEPSRSAAHHSVRQIGIEASGMAWDAAINRPSTGSCSGAQLAEGSQQTPLDENLE